MHQVNQQELDRAAYALAKEFLLQSDADKGVTPVLIEKYLHLSTPRPNSLAGLYEHMLESAQNADRRKNVIGGAIGRVHSLRQVLRDFEPVLVLEKYRSSGWESVLDDIVNQLRPRGSIRRSPRSIWPRYCQTILSSAKFLSQFESASDFYEWVDFFDNDERARPALPMLLAQEIDGLGFALACDFVMGLGYENFSKPDVHIKDIFQGIGLSPIGSSDYEIFKAVARIARNVDVTPHEVDKLFWLVGSGNFHEDPHLGNKGRIGWPKERKELFITLAGPRLEQIQEPKDSSMV
jgi:hypothetical protein